jgi:DNA-binding transcriptional MocR family regulator
MYVVKMDEDGIIITELESKAQELKAVGIWEITPEKPFWAMLYTMPVFHNPTGVILKQGIIYI